MEIRQVLKRILRKLVAVESIEIAKVPNRIKEKIEEEGRRIDLWRQWLIPEGIRQN